MTAENTTAVDDDYVPEEHFLRFPPYPALDGKIKPFGEYETQGIKVPLLPAGEYTAEDISAGLNGWVEDVLKNGTDAHGQHFVELPGSEPGQPKISAGRVYAADSWKLGRGEGEEPELKAPLDNSIARPPFSRLMDATLAFYDSRFEAFQTTATKSLWTTARNAFGLSHTYSILHWGGTGDDAITYEPTRSAHRRVSRKTLDLYNEGAVGEGCCLLRDTDKAVRGFLAMARRETDGMWGIERTLLLLDIVVTFLTYVNLHGVITDEYLAPRFLRAEALARSAVQATKLSKAVEDTISDRDSLNQAAWTVYGGSYMDRQGSAVEAPKEEEDADDGGWGAPIQNNPIVPTPEEARTTLTPMLAPLALNTIKQVNYMPFARRRVTAVIPPDPSADGPAFMKTYYRLRTEPAPWTDEEQWRDHRHREHDDNAEPEPDEELTVFEKEEATLPEPAELDIWIDAAGLDTKAVVGLGFRARWAELSDGTHRWWILKLKDFVLPAFWKSTAAERQAWLADPPAPFPAGPTVPAKSSATNGVTSGAANGAANGAAA